MTILNIFPTTETPYNIKFCDTLKFTELLSIEKVEEVLKDKEFDKIFIVGSEPELLNKEYLNNLIDTILKYNNNVYIKSYPVSTLNINPKVKYIFQYDFLARPHSDLAWRNLMNMNIPFELEISLSPNLYTYHPNAILNKFKLLPNIKMLHIAPCYLTKKMVNIEKLNKQFFKILSQSTLKLPYTVSYIQNIKNHTIPQDENIFLMPTGELMVEKFDDIHRKFVKYDGEIPEKPFIYNFYNPDILNGVKYD